MDATKTISPLQSEVARKHLDWTQQDLATAANIGRSTVRKFEKGGSVRRGFINRIRKTFEQEGIEFIDGDGVKRRWNAAALYRGFDSCEEFYNDILRTIEENGGDLYCVAQSQDSFLRALSIPDYANLGRLEVLGKKTKIKCLLPAGSAACISLPFVEFRMATDYHMIGSDLSFGYGNKYAHTVIDTKGDCIFCVFNLTHTAQNYRLGFMAIWNNAGLMVLKTSQQQRRTKIAITL